MGQGFLYHHLFLLCPHLYPLFLRDRRSYAGASELFSGCQVHLAPDMAFQLAGWLGPAKSTATTTLFLNRGDREALQSNTTIHGVDAIHQDWVSFERKWRWGHRALPLSRTLARWYREGWQRSFLHPREYRLRTAWLDSLRTNPASKALSGPRL